MKNNYLCFFVSILLFSAFSIPGVANMASPIIEGTSLEEVYTSKDIDILNERINIRLLDAYSARFEIIYHIKTEREGLQIPFIFDTYNDYYYEKDSFNISVDDIKLEVLSLPRKYSDFEVLNWIDSAGMDKNIFSDDTYLSRRFQYFEADLTEGIHSIRVEYTAIATVSKWGTVSKFSYQYNLKPVRYWRSFGGLKVEIDDSALPNEVTTNLDTLSISRSGSSKVWTFNELPGDVLKIEYNPEVNSIARLILMAGGEGFMILTVTFILLTVHLILTVRYRKKQPAKKFSPFVIIGGILVPFLWCIAYMFSFYFLDLIIGEYASGRHGYVFLIFILYPFVMPFYLLIVWLIDYYAKSYYKLRYA